MMEAVAKDVGCEPRPSMMYHVATNASVLLLCAAVHQRKANIALAACVPLFGQFFLSSGWLMKYLTFPMWPAWYRMRGPGAQPKVIKDILEKHSMWSSMNLHNLVTLLVGFPLQRVLNVVCYGSSLLNLTSLTDGASPKSLAYCWNRPRTFVLHGNTMKLEDVFRL
jgi:hypothetical protein